ALLLAPPNLLFPIADIEVRDGHLTLKAESTVGTRERAFFETYQRHFGWSAGLSEEVKRQQTEWHQLPADIQRLICTMGAVGHPERRFSPPTVDACLDAYI